MKSFIGKKSFNEQSAIVDQKKHLVKDAQNTNILVIARRNDEAILNTD
jgi:hypothetical protein